MSWFPKFSTFNESGYWRGYWTPECETWFQRWLAVLKKGPASPRMASHWRANLKHEHKNVGAMRHNLIRLNGEDLEELAAHDSPGGQ